MATIKPLSTISYNTPKGIATILQELNPAFYAYVRHKPESQFVKPAETKYHYHLYMRFGKKVEPEKVREAFNEPDPSGNPKPLGAMLMLPCSSFPDWYLYTLHDRAYLEAKGTAREYHYTFEDVITSDVDELRELVACIDKSKLCGLTYMTIFEDAFNRGVRDFAMIMLENRIPVQHLKAWETGWGWYREWRSSRGYNNYNPYVPRDIPNEVAPPDEEEPPKKERKKK